ncbi:putative nuclease HARBI1 [Prorops nasuta]|uniref:putative nuclease HARBI1 n=1 Tax=Prorops nasuta TaxID=863751 RepID=UPI0034CFF4A7
MYKNIINEFIDDDTTCESSSDDSIVEEMETFVENIFLQNIKQAEIANVLLTAVEDSNYIHIHGLKSDKKIKLNYNKDFVEKVIPNYSNVQFFSHFRMSNTSFMELEEILRPHIKSNDITSIRKKILLSIWALATPESFRSVSDRFGLSKSTGWKVFEEVILAIDKLISHFIKWPNNHHELMESERVFHSRCNGFGGVIGAIYGCHIPIKQPPGNAHDYYNRKDFHSVVLQGTCDHTGKFIDCLIGRPGRAHDAAIFKSSAVYKKLTDVDNPLLPPNLHILGDSAYPLLLNLMTPFKDNGNLTSKQIQYNVKHASIRSVIERAYGLLKGKWRRLKYLDVNSVHMANSVIAAACILHNFLIVHKEMDVLSESISNDSNNSDINEYISDIHHNEHEIEDARNKRDLIMNQL